MNGILDVLNSWGCDVAGAMERMDNDEDFYLDCLKEVATDPYFEKLKTALITGDKREAFDDAHTLKGVLANVGLTPMYNKIVEIVEPLRSGHGENLAETYEQLMQMNARLNRLLCGMGEKETEGK